VNFNEQQVHKTVSLIIPILDTHDILYWIEGSLLPTSLNGSLYREVHDLDILIDKDKAELFTQELQKLGYKQKEKNMYSVAERLGIRVFTHDTLLNIGYFSLSTISDPYEITAGPITIKIPKKILTRTRYRFKDIQFYGIPTEGAYALALLSQGNPKRKHEFELYKKLGIKPFKWPLYDLYIFGIKGNWLFDLLNLVLMIIGKIRVVFKKPYDPWQ
jgi:hypothetical protein